MCVISMVYDHYNSAFERYTQQPTPTFTITTSASSDLAELRKLIEDFKVAIEAAKKVDVLTGQPDCEDPEKAKLRERVAELERQLAAVKEAVGP